MSENNNSKLAETLKSIYDSLTEEQKEKLKDCKTMDDLTLLAGKEGIELPDEVLDEVAGGYIYNTGNGYYILDDNNGDVLAEGCRTRDMAIAKAKALGQSTEEITLRQWAWIAGC